MNREIAARLEEAAWLLRDHGGDVLFYPPAVISVVP